MHMKKSSVPALQHYPMVQQIEPWPVDKLIPYAKNPRTHSDDQVAQIAASIAEFGFNNPILVDTMPALSPVTGAFWPPENWKSKKCP